MARVLLLNGPNLNLLGTREPGVYGADTLASIESRLTELAREAGHELSAFQSNAEAELIGKIHGAGEKQAVIGTYGTTSRSQLTVRRSLDPLKNSASFRQVQRLGSLRFSAHLGSA